MKRNSADRRSRCRTGVGTIAAVAALMAPLPMGSGSATAEPGAAVDHLYLSAAATGNVIGYEVSAGAAPQQIAGTPIRTGFGALTIKVSPDRRFLYTVSAGPATEIVVFSIGPGGSLTPVPGTPVAVPEAPLSMNLSPDGRHLVLATGPSLSGGMTLRSYALQQDGVPVELGYSVPAGPLGDLGGIPASMLVVSPDSRNVYVANYLGGTIRRFELHSDGSLSEAREEFACGGGPVSPTISPDGRYLYTSNEFTGNISAFRIESNGSLREVTGSPFRAGSTPHGLTISPEGRFLYTPNALSNNVTGYEVQSDGSLSELPGSPYPGGPLGTVPGQVLISSDGRALHAVDIIGSAPTPFVALRSYSVADDGRLEADSREPVNTGLLFSAASVLVSE
ncbi:beta-propeller fold lactonase family protein [Nocardia sp. NPDC050378]|uniref:lactonase family protein n=1 Tax=Nocardia sp. NPDC050378 TaxID=3155400 RepID=UPI0033CBC52C